MADPILAATHDAATGPRVNFDTDGRMPIGFSPSRGSQMMTSLEVAEALNVTQRWVTDKHNQGHLRGYRLPGSRLLRFDWDEVVEDIEKNGGE